jgi:hypothetical protein
MPEAAEFPLTMCVLLTLMIVSCSQLKLFKLPEKTARLDQGNDSAGRLATGTTTQLWCC